MLEFFQIFPSGECVRLPRPLDEDLRHRGRVVLAKTPLQDTERDSKLCIRWRELSLYLTVRPESLFQLGDMHNRMNTTLRWKLETVGGITNSFRHRKGPIILEKQLAMCTRSHKGLYVRL
jgi:hypothetical protein